MLGFSLDFFGSFLAKQEVSSPLSVSTVLSEDCDCVWVQTSGQPWFCGS